MRALHPLLQDAVHAKPWDAQYTVSGPLTWRQFHRLAGRGKGKLSRELCRLVII